MTQTLKKKNMPHKFILVLGTNQYRRCSYSIGNDDTAILYETNFIQDALIRHQCKNRDTRKGDSITILCTDNAEKTNWLDNGHKKTSPGLSSLLSTLSKEEDYKAIFPDVHTVMRPIPTGRPCSEPSR